MLMFTRKKDESFVIDTGTDIIKVVITEVSKGSNNKKRMVQLGVDAPQKYKVWRSEIFDSIEENKQAAKALKNARSVFK